MNPRAAATVTATVDTPATTLVDPGRRHWLQGTAALLGTGLLGAEAQARPAESAVFERNLQGRPLLTPLRGVSGAGELRCDAPLLRGRWPAELRGRFYRNGPGVLQRGTERYHHWFDGDGMVQQFTITDGQVRHLGRVVQTRKWQTEQAAGRFRLPTLGTTLSDPAPVSGPDSMNTANTNALEFAGRVLAMWEGGSAWGLNPADLSTQGAIAWRADLAQLPFSAHPKVDPQGHLWNFGTFGPHVFAWHLDPQGRLAGFQQTRSPFPDGMVHDMAVTERYLVLPLPPVKMGLAGIPADGGPRRFPMVAGEPLRVLVMEKADISRQRVFELPPQFVFHVGNAHETADGAIELSYVAASDSSFLDHGAVALMRGEPESSARSGFVTARLDLKSGRATHREWTMAMEFPRVDPRRIGLPVRHLAAVASWEQHPGRNDALLHGVQVMDLQRGTLRRFSYGALGVAEEVVVIPKPGRSGELDSWLLGTSFDARRQATVLNLFETAHVEDGPIAQAVLPYVLPLGFHGNFTAA